MGLGDAMRPSKIMNSIGMKGAAKILGNVRELPHQHQPLLTASQDDGISQDQAESSTDMGLDGYGPMHGYRSTINSHLLNNGQPVSYGTPSSLPGYSDLHYSIQSPNYSCSAQSPGTFRLGDSPLSTFPIDSPGPSPAWAMQSPITQYHMCQQPRTYNNPAPRYPVLQPLIPHLGSIIPLSLACDLLDLYFASSSSTQMHPMSPYVLGYVFRKRSFLHPTKPRACSPALLASILWVAAQTSDAPFLAAPPSARGRVCQKLLELTVSLLKPLIHGPSAGETLPNFSDSVVNGVALGGLGVSMPGPAGADTSGINGEGSSFGAAGALDDVVTYIHLATVVAASEYKGASLRWWNAAWSLARELKLGRELPPNQNSANDVDADGEADDEIEVPSAPSSPVVNVTEEEREERRRIWWLVYIVDRHLSLCYNKPLFLLDVECDGLLQPMDDALWQAGEFYSGDSSIHITSPHGSDRIRRRGPNFECTGHSIFGYFLPLMTILGEIVDLNHARNHPRFGVSFRSAQEWDDHTNEIALQLEAYGRSLEEFEQRYLATLDASESNIDSLTQHDTHNDIASPSVHSVNTSVSRMTTESDIQTRVVVAYGTHVMHVLHILLTGKWDPISLLDDNDLWISSQSFINATSHAVSAAEAIESILEFDPGLEFMPFFFGVYLLQGSFILLLIADKLQSEASPNVVRACETIVRAHEACVVTLNSEYQVNS
jgi:xylanolytic transcriptional activator XlnR